MPSKLVTTIGFDADDTLWQNELFFRSTEKQFVAMLADHGDEAKISARLLEAEKRNLATYGFGIKGFTLSMIETSTPRKGDEGHVEGTRKGFGTIVLQRVAPQSLSGNAELHRAPGHLTWRLTAPLESIVVPQFGSAGEGDG